MVRRVHWPTVFVSALVGVLFGILGAAATVAYSLWTATAAQEVLADIEPSARA